MEKTTTQTRPRTDQKQAGDIADSLHVEIAAGRPTGSLAKELYDLAVLAEQGASAQQRKQGEIMMKMVEILSDRLREVAVMVEAKLRIQGLDIEGLSIRLPILKHLRLTYRRLRIFFGSLRKILKWRARLQMAKPLNARFKIV